MQSGSDLLAYLVQRSTDRHRSEVLCTHGGQLNEWSSPLLKLIHATDTVANGTERTLMSLEMGILPPEFSEKQKARPDPRHLLID